MDRRAFLGMLGGGLLAAPLAAAQPAGPVSLRDAELLAALRGGGCIMYFRHADTDHNQHDTPGQSPQDCAKQRNLTDRGRDHARAIGQTVRALTIPIGLVLASPLCRTVETATLAFGTAERSSAAREAGPAPPGSPERFAELRRLLSIVPPKGTNTVIVGHAYPFYSLVGGQYLEEGEAAIVQPDGAGFQVVARLGLKQWQELARSLPRSNFDGAADDDSPAQQHGPFMIHRRAFLAGTFGLLAAPLAAEAQQTGKVYRIGMLETRSPELNAANVDAFRQGLRELGYKEGQNLEIVYRSSDGREERFSGLASELVRLKVDLILTRGTPATLAAKSATRTIPVVMAASGDPVGSGLVASLGRPGGNVTGLSLFNVEMYAKRVELLKELLPKLARIGAIFNMGNPVTASQWHVVEASARSLGIQPQLLDVRRPEDLPRAFDAAAKQRAEALIVGIDGVTQGNLRPIAERAVKQRLPSMYAEKAYAVVGGLMTHGASDPHMYRRAATFVDKIFKGAKPADLPIEQPTTFELVINMKTAKALGLTIPRSLVQRADELIQ